MDFLLEGIVDRRAAADAAQGVAGSEDSIGVGMA